ncbi:MAG: DUF4255 domain-containing protein [Nitrospiria bacterium]
MISDVLVFLKNHLNEAFTRRTGWAASETQEDKVVFLDGEKMDPLVFKLGAVSCLLMNIEEENTLRTADPYRSVAADGTVFKVQPEIRINLFVLFVARFKAYEQSLSHLSQIIQHFQSHRVMDHQNAPGLNEKIEKLVMELTTLPFSEQNEIWNALRTTYHPSVLYKVKMIVARDEDAKRTIAVKEKEVRLPG